MLFLSVQSAIILFLLFLLIIIFVGEENSHVCKQHTIFHQYKAESKVPKYYPSDAIVNFDLTKFDLKVRGDVTLQFFDHDTYAPGTVMSYYVCL